MDRPISKRAIELNQLKEAVFHLWHTNEGFFQNLFRLVVSNALGFVPGYGLALWAINQLASMLGWGLEDLGKYIDQKLGMAPGTNIDQREIDRGGALLESLVKSASTHNRNHEIVKNAFLGALLAKGIKAIFGNFIVKTISYLLLAVGVDQISDLYKKVKQNPVEYAMKNIQNVPGGEEAVQKQLEQGLMGMFGGSISGMENL